MSPATITVAIVEDDAGMRSSLEEIIHSEPGLNCVASFTDGESAVSRLPALRPNVVLMDINLPGISGVECVSRLADELIGSHIIMLTVYDDTDAIFQSLSAGAGGYLLKPVRKAQLLNAIREILAGGAPMSSNIARCVVQAFQKPTEKPSEITQLSPREREILELLAHGLLLKEIAAHFSVSHTTIQTHIGRIYKKLHVHSRSQAVAKLQGKRSAW
jgi:DNA-binding NarL/FixJ family response regulator